MSKYKIKTLINDVRMSTQELLQLIDSKIKEGVTEFEIEACGQHNIGIRSGDGEKGKPVTFYIKNPGQRVGAMAPDGTKIIVEDSVPADVGWLNAGAKIIIKGDAGDTAAHCAAGGKIYVSGRVGTRSGALMKHDPKFEPPEFWVLKNAGSFSFEFMGGGIGVICGIDSEDLPSVLGKRSCTGMVGGIVYVRGKTEELSACVEAKKLDKYDKDFLKSGLPDFLKEIGRKELLEELSDFSKWLKLVPKKREEKTSRPSITDFKQNEWFPNGLFGALVEDNGEVFELAGSGNQRLRKPVWDKNLCVNCKLCLNNCPQNAITESGKVYVSEDSKCIGCAICTGVCPKGAWKMIKNPEAEV